MKFDIFYRVKWDFRDISYGSDINQKLDIIIPKTKTAHGIVYIHGGAYLIGDKSQYPLFLAEYAKNNVGSSDYMVEGERSKFPK